MRANNKGNNEKTYFREGIPSMDSIVLFFVARFKATLVWYVFCASEHWKRKELEQQSWKFIPQVESTELQQGWGSLQDDRWI